MSNNDITTTDSTELEQFKSGSGSMLGMEGLDRSDMTVPRYRLIQNTSSDGTPGKFVSTLSGQEVDTITAVLMKVTKTRVMWPVAFSRGDKPECRSEDGKHKANGIGTGVCDTCPYGKWDGRCKTSYTFLGVDDNSEPFMINIKGSSIKPLKKFLTRILMKDLPLFAYKVVISAKEERNDKGRFWVTYIDFILENGVPALHGREEMLHYAQVLRQVDNALTPTAYMEDETREPIIIEGDLSTAIPADDLPF